MKRARKARKAKKKAEQAEEKFVYCNQRFCPHTECMRHYANAPFDQMIRVDRFYPGEEWECDDIVVEV